MSQINALLSKRLNKEKPSSKMAALAEKSAAGELSTFGGIFNVTALSQDEKWRLESILQEYSEGKNQIGKDLEALIAITSEVKAINHQAALLHGERIQKAQEILKNYKEGAFTSWMIAVYGNRQTPYNLLHYYHFYQAIPPQQRPKIEGMPRQAVYSIASRQGELEQKIQFLLDHHGKRKSELLLLMRDLFPLNQRDKRKEKPVEGALTALEKALLLLSRKRGKLSEEEKEAFKERLFALQSVLKEKS